MTVTSTVPTSCAGVVNVSSVPSSETESASIGSEPSTDTVASSVKPVPVTVTTVPPATGPLSGSSAVIVGTASGPAFGPTAAEARLTTAVPAAGRSATRSARCVKTPSALVSCTLACSDTTVVRALASGVTTVSPRPATTWLIGATTCASTGFTMGRTWPTGTGTPSTVTERPCSEAVSCVTTPCSAVVTAGRSCVVSASVMYGSSSVFAGRLLMSSPAFVSTAATSTVIAPVCRFAVIEPSALVTSPVAESSTVTRFGMPSTSTSGPSTASRSSRLSTVGWSVPSVVRRSVTVAPSAGLVSDRSSPAMP